MLEYLIALPNDITHQTFKQSNEIHSKEII